MIRRIIVSTFFVLLIFSLSLYLLGVRHVDLGIPFLTFLRKCSLELQSISFKIPDIPTIPDMQDVNGIGIVLDVLIKFVNGLVNVLNFIIMVLNTIIQLLEFVFIILKNAISLRNQLADLRTIV